VGYFSGRQSSEKRRGAHLGPYFNGENTRDTTEHTGINQDGARNVEEGYHIGGVWSKKKYRPVTRVNPKIWPNEMKKGRSNWARKEKGIPRKTTSVKGAGKRDEGGKDEA